MRLVFAAVLLVFSACLSHPVRSDAGDVADASEWALLAQGGPELTSTQLLVQLLDDMVAIDGSAEALQNVESTRVKAAAALKGCGTVSVMGAKVTLDLGAAPGCVSTSGVQVSGVVSFGVSQANTTTTLLVTFGHAVLGGKTLDGELTFSTLDGRRYSVTGNLTGTKDTQYSLTFTVDDRGVTLNGNVAATRSGQVTTVMMGSVFWSAGDCYPRAGQATFKQGVALTMTATFDAQTPATGVVTMKNGRREFSIVLPAYDMCP
ncbi:MAG: hypothetical protein K1X64_18725 [Myxococcaceae bacterium]|nr:hypothetical protein [Myxococcaceae bacterium]